MNLKWNMLAFGGMVLAMSFSNAGLAAPSSSSANIAPAVANDGLIVRTVQLSPDGKPSISKVRDRRHVSGRHHVRLCHLERRCWWHHGHRHCRKVRVCRPFGWRR